MTPVDCSVHSVTTLLSYEEGRELEEGELEKVSHSVFLPMTESSADLKDETLLVTLHV